MLGAMQVLPAEDTLESLLYQHMTPIPEPPKEEGNATGTSRHRRGEALQKEIARAARRRPGLAPPAMSNRASSLVREDGRRLINVNIIIPSRVSIGRKISHASLGTTVVLLTHLSLVREETPAKRLVAGAPP